MKLNFYRSINLLHTGTLVATGVMAGLRALPQYRSAPLFVESRAGTSDEEEIVEASGRIDSVHNGTCAHTGKCGGRSDGIGSSSLSGRECGLSGCHGSLSIGDGDLCVVDVFSFDLFYLK
jgi:hypothetical protein